MSGDGEHEGGSCAAESLEEAAAHHLESDEGHAEVEDADDGDAFVDEGHVGTEDAENGSGEDHGNEECNEGENCGVFRGRVDDFFYPGEFLRAVIETDDGLQALGESEDGQEEEGVDAVGDAADGEVDVVAVVND